jgi:hypothetical protein
MELIQKGGGVDRAIAMLAAQRKEYEKSRDEASVAARSSFGGQGNGQNFGDPLAFNCQEPSGTYCSSNYQYWMSKDAVAITNYQISAIECYRRSGL